MPFYSLSGLRQAPPKTDRQRTTALDFRMWILDTFSFGTVV
jgi:hypothetical protein